MNRKPTKNRFTVPVAAALAAALFAPLATAQFDTGITYQGELKSGGAPKTGTVDLRFDQFLVETGGTTPFDAVIVDGVVLDQGRFTVQLPFPPSTFANGQIFMEVGVREDAAGGPADLTGFTSLLPRQKVTPTPYSLIARKVLDDAVAGSSIVNGSVTSSDIADGSITAADVNTTSTTTGLQRRMTGSCPSGQTLVNIAANGAPACVDAVFAIAATSASGLTTTRDDATGIVSLALSSTSGQVRTFGECERGSAAINAINPDGTVQCSYFGAETPSAQVLLDSIGDVGRHLSARRTDSRLGIVSVAYYDDTNNRLKYLSCSNVNCSSPPTTLVIDDPANDVGQFVSLADIGGRATMAYYDATADDLKLARCATFDCSGGPPTITIVDSVGDVGRFAEIMEIGGRVGIAYHDSSNNGYKFALCNDASCSAPTITVLTGLTGGGTLLSDIAAARIKSLGRARFALISQAGQVLMVSCSNIDCSSFTTEIVSSSSDVAPPLAMMSISMAGTERHWVSYLAPGSGFLVIRHCLDSGCSAVASVTGSSFPQPASLAMAPTDQGLPVLLETTADGVAAVAAQNFLRSTTTGAQRLPGTASTGGQIDAVRVSPQGVGMFFYDTIADDLVYQRCGRDDCSEL